MNVVLVHPKHGAKVATLQAEIDVDLKNGWVPYVKPVMPVIEQSSITAVQESVRRGRKPKLPDFLG